MYIYIYVIYVYICKIFVLATRRHYGAGLSRKEHQKEESLRGHDENHCCFFRSNIPVIDLIVGSRTMIRVLGNVSF